MLFRKSAKQKDLEYDLKLLDSDIINYLFDKVGTKLLLFLSLVGSIFLSIKVPKLIILLILVNSGLGCGCYFINKRINNLMMKAIKERNNIKRDIEELKTTGSIKRKKKIENVKVPNYIDIASVKRICDEEKMAKIVMAKEEARIARQEERDAISRAKEEARIARQEERDAISRAKEEARIARQEEKALKELKKQEKKDVKREAIKQAKKNIKAKSKVNTSEYESFDFDSIDDVYEDFDSILEINRTLISGEKKDLSIANKPVMGHYIDLIEDDEFVKELKF